MCDKIKKVNEWLSLVFGDQAVASFEVNTRTVDILYQLAEMNETRCNEITRLIDDHRQKASEYQADGIHLQDVMLQGLGLSCGSLSKPASDYLSNLVESAMVLGVRDTSLGSFLPAVNNLTNELVESEKSDLRLGRELKAVRKRLGATLVLRKNLQEDVNKIVKAQEIECAKAEERLLNRNFAKEKSKDLHYRNKKAEQELVSRNMEEKLSHEAIAALSQEVTALKLEIIPQKKKLAPYADLSPSPSLAQVKIEEAKRELAALDAQLEMKVNFMNSSSMTKGRLLK